jgi:GT2 family glycosyltransferase/glycosyltransferase involved in cell wall biosynthesis
MLTRAQLLAAADDAATKHRTGRPFSEGTRPVIRWVKGDGHDDDVTRAAVGQATRLFGDRVDYCLCTNSLDAPRVRRILEWAEQPVEWWAVSEADNPALAASLGVAGCRPEQFGYWWKWFPERVRRDAPEWILDGDMVVVGPPEWWDEWVRGTDPCRVSQDDTWPADELYGRYGDLVDLSLRLYSGLISLPPRLSYMPSILNVLARRPLERGHDGTRDMCEQGVIAAAFQTLRAQPVPLFDFPFARAVEPELDFGKHGDRGTVWGYHFGHAFRRPNHHFVRLAQNGIVLHLTDRPSMPERFRWMGGAGQWGIPGWGSSSEIKALVEHYARPFAGRRVLELGTSRGAMAALLATLGCKVTTVDRHDRGASDNLAGLTCTVVQTEAAAFLQGVTEPFALIVADLHGNSRAEWSALWPLLQRVAEPGGMMLLCNATLSQIPEWKAENGIPWLLGSLSAEWQSRLHAEPLPGLAVVLAPGGTNLIPPPPAAPPDVVPNLPSALRLHSLTGAPISQRLTPNQPQTYRPTRDGRGDSLSESRAEKETVDSVLAPDNSRFAPSELRDLPYRRRRGLASSPLLQTLRLLPHTAELLWRTIGLRSADWKSMAQRALHWVSAPWSRKARLRSIEAGEFWNPSSHGVVLYAHYARNGAVSAMVLSQLEAYSRLGFNVIVASSAVRPGSAGWQALRSKAAFVIGRRNVGYDFGSWSDALPLLLKNFPDVSEVLLVNDSVVGPLRPLEPLFVALRAQGEGLFGLTDSYQIRPHLQSYFLLARGAAAVADLAVFLRAMPIALTKRRAIRRGEIALSEWMRRRGHKVVAMFGYERVETALVADPADRAALLAALRWWRRPWNIRQLGELDLHRRLLRTPLNPTHHMASVLVRRFSFPFIKTELLLRNPGRLPEALRWRDWLSAECPCDVAMIEGHLSDITRSPLRSAPSRSTVSRPASSQGRLMLPLGSSPAPAVPPSFPSLDEPPEVSVIIPTFGGVEMTLRCLASLSEPRPHASLEVIVAEDASGNPAVTQLGSVPGIRMLLQRENLGFLRNCNAAAAQARGEYLLFLNDDTQVLPGAVDALLDLARRRPDAGLVGAKLVYPDGGLQEAGGIIWRDASGLNFGRGDPDPYRSEYEYVREVDYCSGAALLMRRALFEELGGFDPAFSPAYYEDTDIAFRVRQRGLKVLFQPRAVVVHHEGATHGTDTSSGIKALQPLNRQIMLERWYGELTSSHAEPGAPSLRARDRAFGRPLVLVADHKVPEPDRDAGSRSCFDILRTLLELGAVVKFLPDNGMLSGSYGAALQDLGIEVLQGSRAATLEWIAKHGAELDAVLLQRPNVAEQLLPALRAARVKRIAYYGHDLHYTREYQQAAIQRDAHKLSQAAVTEQLERRLCREVDMALFPSVDEVATMRKIERGAALQVLPLYRVEATVRRDAPPISEDMLLVGGFAHPPNEDAARWFAAEILPQILIRQPKARLLVAGSDSERLAGTFTSPAVRVLGTLDEAALQQLYAEARVSVVPLRFGAGVKGKIVEAMAQGLPLVTTPVGAQGLPGLDGIVPVHADAAGFVQAVLHLMADDSLWQQQSARQADYARTEFAPSRMRHALVKALDIVVKPTPCVLSGQPSVRPIEADDEAIKFYAGADHRGTQGAQSGHYGT